MTYRSSLLPVYFLLCQELSQQNRGGLIFLSPHGSLATSCYWKISNTDWLSIISGIHQPALQMVFPLQKSHKISYEIRNLPLAVAKEEKKALSSLGVGICKDTHNYQNTHYPVMKRSTTETQVHFHYLTVKSGTSLSKIETASADTYKKNSV